MSSFAAIEAYNQYLTQYSQPVSKNKEDLHDTKKLKDVYGSIQKKNSNSPVFLNEASQDEILNALILKNEVYSYHQDIAKLYINNPEDPFMQKFPYSSNKEIADVQIGNKSSNEPLPQSLSINIESFATPQTNIGSFLPAQNLVSINNGNYSFDLMSKKLNYELQFNVYPNDTNEELQNRIANLINKSNLGITSGILKDGENTALCIISDSTGVPLKGDLHFALSDDNTSQTAGIIDYLGLNAKIASPQNARISYNDTVSDSYDNTFSLFDNYELKLTPMETYGIELPINIEIGFYPDVESLSKNITGFVDGYNDLRNELTKTGSSNVLRKLNSLVESSLEAISKFGIEQALDKSLLFNPPDDWDKANPEIADTSPLTGLGNKILKTLQDVSVDPMQHINRKIGIYSNPIEKNTLNKPYLNNYSGLIYRKTV